MASSLSNRNEASALQSSVLPTPVGPRNRNEPIGRFGSDSPARLRRIALDTALTASFWPMTRECSSCSRRNSLSRSPSSILATGIPVARASTSAISASVTRLRSSFIVLPSASVAAASCFSSSGILPYCSSDIRPRSPTRRACSRLILACSRSALIFCVPESEAFSAFHSSSSSEYSRSFCSSSPLSISRRFLLASSDSLLKACCSSLS
ncbi:hypothetical protein D3C71_1500050 [compost metagenome]